MQIDQAAHGGRALNALVQSHRPEAEHGTGAGPEAGDSPQILLGDSTQCSRTRRRPGGHVGLEILKAFGGGGHKRTIDAAGLQKQMGDAMQQGQIRARGDGQMPVGNRRCGRGAGVNHDDVQGTSLALLALEQALEQHRVTIGGICADQNHQIGQIDVFIAAGWAIGTQAAGIA